MHIVLGMFMPTPILMRAIHGAHPDGRAARVQFCSWQDCPEELLKLAG